MKIYITRHGESQWNILKRTQGSKNTILTGKGISQAIILSNRLLEDKISEIYTSDLDRAYQTANIIGKRLGLEPRCEKRLREISLGVWEGLTTEDIDLKFPNQLSFWHNDLNFKPLNGESIIEVKKRANGFLNTILDIGHTQSILVVSHAIVCKVLITELLNIPTEYLWCFKIDNTSISIIDVKYPTPVALCINDTCHIQS